MFLKKESIELEKSLKSLEIYCNLTSAAGTVMLNKSDSVLGFFFFSNTTTCSARGAGDNRFLAKLFASFSSSSYLCLPTPFLDRTSTPCIW